MSIVKVKRVKQHGWGGQTVKAYNGAKTRLGIPIDRQGNRITGLNDADARRLETALYEPVGRFNRNSDYWDSFTVDIIGLETMILDTEDPNDELKYLVLKARKDVAKSVVEAAAKPNSLLVMYNDDDEAEKANTRGKNKRLAGALFDTLSTDDMKNILMLYGNFTDSNSSAVIENNLERLMEDDPVKFLSFANDPVLKQKTYILKLARAGVLRRKGQAFIEEGTEDIIAYTMDDMVKFLEDKKNNSTAIRFKEALKNRG